MHLGMGMQAGVFQALELQPWPQLITFAELLQLPALDLEQRIERELEFNPALERAEVKHAPPNYWNGTDHDWFERLPDPDSLRDGLLDEARLELGADDQPIAEHLLASLNGRGLLDESLEDISSALHVSPERVQRVLRVLRRLGDAGLGATSIRECLLLQLEEVETQGFCDPIARELVNNYLEDLAQLSNSRLAHELGVASERIAQAREFIRCRLRPPVGADSGVPAPRLRPDVVIHDSEPLEVELVEHTRLQIDPLYLTLAESNRHAADCVRRASHFLFLIHGRAGTIQRVVRCAALHQLAFLRSGQRSALRRLSRAEVARLIGVHESTVSRALQDKTAQLPSGHLAPLSIFFDTCDGLEDVLRRLIAHEPRALSDAELAQQLSEFGYRVARRTVAKYRDKLGLPAATARS
jgi:RNA polymerase sigma-54 factor